MPLQDGAILTPYFFAYLLHHKPDVTDPTMAAWLRERLTKTADIVFASLSSR